MSKLSLMVVAALSAAMVLIACGGAPKPPDLITRDLPGSGDAPKRDASTPYLEEDLDAGSILFDGGICCTVRFALPANPEETSATWVGPGGRRVAMTKANDVWETNVCMPLEVVNYYFETAIPNEPAVGEGLEVVDAGDFFITRINDSVMSVPGSLVDALNRFDGTGTETCAALDAGVYGVASFPDAGN